MKFEKWPPQIVSIIILTLIFGTPKALGADLSFKQALVIMQSKNETIQAAKMAVDKHAAERLAAQGLHYPKVDINARYTKINDPISIDLNDIRASILALHPTTPSELMPPFALPVQDESFRRLNASLTLPLYTGGRIQAVNRAADAQLESTENKLRSVQASLISELVQRYFGFRLANHIVQVRKQVLAGMDAHLHNAEKLEENGMVARAERLHAQVAQAEADRLYKKAVRDIALAQTAFNNTLSTTQTWEPTSPLFIVHKIAPIDDFIKRASENNPVLAVLGAQKKMAHQWYRRELGTFLPEVFLFGKRELYTDDLTILDPEWAVGIGVNITLFEGLTRFNRTKASKKAEQQVAYVEQRAQWDVKAQVEKQYQELMKTIEQYDALEIALDCAEEYLRVRARAFHAGLATSLDVVDAENALSRVKIERLSAAYDFGVALSKLLGAAGQSMQFEAYLAGDDVEMVF